MPSFAALFASLLFGSIGLVAFRLGKVKTQVVPMVIGVLLMVFPYFVSQTWQIYLVGALLCGAWYGLRDY
jgi:hypothetical protein